MHATAAINTQKTLKNKVISLNEPNTDIIKILGKCHVKKAMKECNIKYHKKTFKCKASMHWEKQESWIVV